MLFRRQTTVTPWLLIAVVLMLGLHPIAMYLYLPVLPALQSSLGLSATAAQGTLSAAVVSFGVGQILWGGPTDRWGRRPVMLAGVSIYTLGALGLWMTHAMPVFMLCRVAQGLGVAAAGVACRAMLRDISTLRDRAHHLSWAFSWLGVISLLVPPLGALAYEHAGMGATLLLMVGYGVLCLVVIAMQVRETRPSIDNRASRFGSAQWSMLNHSSFRRYTSITACSYIGHYLFMAGSSYSLITRLHVSPFAYGVMLAAGSVVHMGGTFYCRRALRCHDLEGTLNRAAWMTLIGGVSIALLSLGGVHAVWSIVLPQSIYIFGHAIHQSCGQAAVNECFPERAGSASALSGVLVATPAALLGWVLARGMASSDVPMTLSMAICGLVIAAIVWRAKSYDRADTMTAARQPMT